MGKTLNSDAFPGTDSADLHQSFFWFTRTIRFIAMFLKKKALLAPYRSRWKTVNG